MNNIKKGIKTTITGIVFLILGIVYMFFSLSKEIDLNLWIFGGTIGSGVAFIYFPDDFIGKLKLVLKNFKINDKSAE